MKTSEEYEQFLACFNDAHDIIVPTEELEKRMAAVHTWMESLVIEDRIAIAHTLVPIVTEAQKKIKQKQVILEETILINHSVIKANSKYGKY